MLDSIVEEVTGGIGKNLSKAGDVLATEGLKEGIKRSNTEKNAISDGRADITQYASQRLMDKMDEIEVPAEYAKIALINELETIVNKRSILDKIFGKAKIIVQTTPQDDTNSNDNIGEISDDWLNEFRDVACKKSSEEAQELFSKVLSGEIRKPGSFSLLALTTLANMDQEITQLFNNFCSLSIVYLEEPNEFLKSDTYFNIKDVRMPFLTGDMSDVGTTKHIHPSILDQFNDRSDSIYKEHGLGFKEIQLLKDLRLIENSSLMYYKCIWFNNELWAVTLPTPHTPHTPLKEEDIKDIRIAGYALTSAGRELFHLTERDTSPQYWEIISKFIQDFYNVNLYKIPKPEKIPAPDSTTPNNE